jgi:hypothetical protein
MLQMVDRALRGKDFNEIQALPNAGSQQGG